MGTKEYIQKAKQLLKESDCIFIIAGAGMGVDSGLPDYRGAEGLWNEYPKARELGLNLFDKTLNFLEEVPNEVLSEFLYFQGSNNELVKKIYQENDLRKKTSTKGILDYNLNSIPLNLSAIIQF